ncbi:MAG: hypothetical protein M1826_005424 [Phylliscum demangeonii]|nr:MAG: hypothetical protein M1826_005424 [Phylliscum demangeonii]
MPEQSSVNPPEGFGALAALPPQLRASVFFEHPSTYQEVSIKQQSAVATLDSILDASAYAPVSAFTDHPFAAHLGAPSLPREPARVRSSEITGSKVRKKNSWSSLSNLLDAGSSRPTRTLGRRSVSIDLLSQFGRRKSETLDGLDPQDRAPLASSRSSRSGGSNDRPGEESRSIPAAELAPAREDEMGIEGQMESLPGNARSPLHYAQPTTLLAELQLRKVQQRQRNMTAATAFPNGMHSTLLELDTVAEVQKLSRKHKRITLAWEDPNRPEIGPAIEDDDVPLGMLFPTIKNRAPSDERPSGLLEQRHQEENEPLSRRRDRLRASGGVMPRAAHSARLMRGGMSVNLPGVFDPMEDDDALDEDETLAERARRLKGGSGSRRPSHGRRLSSEFATELLDRDYAVNQALNFLTSAGPERWARTVDMLASNQPCPAGSHGRRRMCPERLLHSKWPRWAISHRRIFQETVNPRTFSLVDSQ